jgi:hypothetical protein
MTAYPVIANPRMSVNGVHPKNWRGFPEGFMTG